MQNAQSISEISPFTTPEIGATASPAPLHVVSRGQSRASNDARAWLVEADVTPTGYRVGKFLANHARYATAADVRRRVVPGEVFTYWLQANIAAELGCSERQVQRGIRSLREAGALDVRQRVRPCEASYVLLPPVGSGVGSGVGSHTEPRTEPRTEEKVRTLGKPSEIPDKAEKGRSRLRSSPHSAQQRMVAAIAVKLDLPDLLTAEGLESFACLENSEKQALITRLLRVEARYDRRAKTGSNSANCTIPAKTQMGQVGQFQGRPRAGRLQREYAARWRSAHDE